jgi:hypothetical protein
MSVADMIEDRSPGRDMVPYVPRGRPSGYNREIADAICERLIEGESLRSICRDPDMPHASTVCRWLSGNAPFREQYARAREAQADTLTDEMLDIADDGRNDWVMRQSSDGSTDVAYDGDHVQRSKLRIDARKWIASKLAPKKYGDKTAVELTGADGGPIALTLAEFYGRSDPKSLP